MRRNLITELFRYERIKTTKTKAKAIRPEAEKLITLARNRGDADRLVDLAEEGDEETLRRLLTSAQAGRLLRWAEDEEIDELEREARAIVAHAQRLVAKEIHDREILWDLFHEIAPRYVGRNGGYTRILKLGKRKGDNAEMVLLELVEDEI
jgi:large subunit ribosomal protein L17